MRTSVHEARRRAPDVARRALNVLAAVLLLSGVAAAGDSIQDLALDLRLIPLDGQPAPAFTLSSLDGKRLSLADFKGQVVLLYFWASW